MSDLPDTESGTMILLPQPRSLFHTAGVHELPLTGLILVMSPQDLLPAAQLVQEELRRVHGLHYPLVSAGPAYGVVIDICISEDMPHTEGYSIEITPERAELTAASPEAAFWGAQTLAQIIRQHGRRLPCLEIHDQPDFRTRGVMLDISRAKVPTMQTLYQIVDDLAALKINHLQLYTEHTFAYRNHPDVWRQADPLTGEEVLLLDRYCAQRYIELVPNQNSFGHMERWLKHDHYRDLAETPGGFELPWGGRHKGGFSLNPTDPRAIELIASLYDELLPHFSSPLFNVGCDETFDLGLGRSKEQCKRRGKGEVYLSHLLKLHELLQDHSRVMMFWGDIILNHPELLERIPRDVIALEWGYEADHPFDEHAGRFDDAGIPFFVCPGTSSWCSFGGRTDNAIANLKNAARAGLEHNASGYLITDWGDQGHLQYLPISWPGFAAGAAFSWSLAANEDLDLATALSAHVLRDESNAAGALICNLGNVYRVFSKPTKNGTPYFWTLVGGEIRKQKFEQVTSTEWADAHARIEELAAQLSRLTVSRADAVVIVGELANAMRMMQLGCAKGRDLQHAPALPSPRLETIVEEHRRLWLARNRPGGLADSLSKLTGQSCTTF